MVRTWWRIQLFGLLAPATLLSCGACSTLPAATSSVIGCQPDDIEISNAANGPTGDTWTASCNGNVYDCAREEKPLETQDALGKDYHVLPRTYKGDTHCIMRDRE